MSTPRVRAATRRDYCAYLSDGPTRRSNNNGWSLLLYSGTGQWSEVPVFECRPKRDFIPDEPASAKQRYLA
jgi:hypothetical protein